MKVSQKKNQKTTLSLMINNISQKQKKASTKDVIGARVVVGVGVGAGAGIGVREKSMGKIAEEDLDLDQIVEIEEEEDLGQIAEREKEKDLDQIVEKEVITKHDHSGGGRGEEGEEGEDLTEGECI